MRQRLADAARLRLLAMALLWAAGCTGQPEAELLVAVASSLRGAMPEIIESFERSGAADRAVATYGGLGTLRAQVEAGAPIDVVVLAGVQPVERLIAGGYAAAESRRVVATNQLVLVALDRDSPLRFANLAEELGNARLAIGQPDAAPVGAYTRTLLRASDDWDRLEPRLIQAAHVAAVLAYVRRGEVAAGVVYNTDALSAPRLAVLDRAPSGVVQPRIVAAVTSAPARAARARAFVDYLNTPEARAILASHGFGSSVE